MYLLRNNKTGLEYEVSDENFAEMQKNGNASRYTIVKKGATVKAEPVTTNYDKLLSDAKEAFDAKDYVKALDLYKQVNGINQTQLTTQKIKEIEKLINTIK